MQIDIIQQGSIYNQNKRQIKPNFTAIPLARYHVQSKDFVTIYQAEKSDLALIDKFLNNLQKYFNDKKINDFAHCQVMEEAFLASKKILTSAENKKSKILFAVSESNLCGVLVGNVAKKDNTKGSLVYSSRKNKGNHETELDWLTTWNYNPNKKIRNIGKALMTEYYNLLPMDKFKQVYVRSEVPELSYAVEFYKSVGFKELYSERKRIMKYQTNRYTIGDYDSPKDKVIPMLATNTQIKKTKKEISKTLEREELSKISAPLNISH